MKRFLLVFVMISLYILMSYNHALADRYVDADNYRNIEDFFDAIEMGTIVTVNGFIISDQAYLYEMDNIV